MQRTQKKIFKPKKHKKVWPWQYLLPDIAKKAIAQTIMPLKLHTKFS